MEEKNYGPFKIVPITEDESQKQFIDAREYRNYYVQIRDKLPSAFLQKFETCERFHDFYVNSICYTLNPGENNLLIELAGEHICQIVFSPILSFNAGIVMHQYLINERIECQGFEFYLTEKEQWKIDISTTGGNISFICNNISITDI